MILYFSGTGNSQLAARQISAVIPDETGSIHDYLKEGINRPFHSELPWVFVTPTYAWRIPRVVDRWIREAHLEGSSDAYFVLTCDGSCGNAAAYARKLCREKGLHFRGLAHVAMPENYVAMFSTPGEEECREILRKAKPRIAELASLIREGKSFPETAISMKDRIQSGPVNTLFYPLLVKDRGFTVSEACVSCGKCAKRCPLNNIIMVKGKPVWQGDCTHCMACIGGCPAEAIEYKNKSQGKRRYYIRED